MKEYTIYKEGIGEIISFKTKAKGSQLLALATKKLKKYYGGDIYDGMEPGLSGILFLLVENGTANAYKKRQYETNGGWYDISPWERYL